MNEKVSTEPQTTAERLHAAAEYFFDRCIHGTYHGGPNHGQPFKACELLANRITDAEAYVAAQSASRLLGGPCEHYAIERFDNGDHPDWCATGEFYRTREAAEAYVAAQNARCLKALNDRWRDWYDACVRQHRESKALYEAGLRTTYQAAPPEFAPITGFSEWNERYRAVPIEFEEDRVRLTPQDPGEFLRERGRTTRP